MKKHLLLFLMAKTLIACDSEENSSSGKQDTGFLEKLGFAKMASNDTLGVQPLQTDSGAYLIGRHAQLEQDWHEAGKSYYRLLKNSDGNVDLVKRAMVLSVGSGEMETAVELAQRIVESNDKDSALALLILAVQSLKEQDYKETLGHLDAMSLGGVAAIVKPALMPWVTYADSKTFPPLQSVSNGLTVYNEVLASDFAGDKERLKTLATQYVPRATLSAKLSEQIGDILVRNDLREEALTVYKKIDTEASVVSKIEKLEKGEPIDKDTLFQAVESVEKGIAMALTDMAVLFYQENGTDSSRIFAHMAIYLDDTQKDSQALLAYMAADIGRPNDAISYFSSITSENQDEYIDAQRQIARLYEDEDKILLAVETLKSLVSKTDSIEAQIQIGDIYRHEEEYRKALDAYNTAFKMIDNPDDTKYWSLYYSRGIANERVGKMDDAEKDLRKALSYKPDHPFILNYLGYSFADKGENLDEALQMIQKAVDLEPNDGYIADSLGWVYFRMERYDDALPHLEKAAELLPYDPTINDHLGDLYWQLGRKQEARFQWRRALSNTELEEDKPQIEAKIENGLEEPDIMERAER